MHLVEGTSIEDFDPDWILPRGGPVQRNTIYKLTNQDKTAIIVAYPNLSSPDTGFMFEYYMEGLRYTDDERYWMPS